MNREELVNRLRQQRNQLEQELTQHILHIENLNASIQAIEDREINRPSFPPQNPFKGVPIGRIDTSTYLNIARRLIDNKNNVRVPGIRGEPLVKELNICIGEVESIINRLDNQAEQLIGTRDVRTIQQIQDERDKLRIELEFYKDLAEAIQTELRRLSQEELTEERYKAKE